MGQGNLMLLSPVIGSWYQNVAGESFEVVAHDPDDSTIEIQYFDGTVEELDQESWEEIVVQTVAAPEDWSGSMDIDRLDYGVDLDASDERSSWTQILDT